MATITPQAAPGATAAALTYNAASSGGDTIATAGNPTVLLIKNASGSSVTATLAGVNACPQINGTTHNVPVVVAAGAEQSVRIPGQCVDATTGHAALTYSTNTSVTVAAYKASS